MFYSILSNSSYTIKFILCCLRKLFTIYCILFIHVNIIYIMYTFLKKYLLLLLYCHTKAGFGYPFEFWVSAGFDFGMDFDPNRCSDRVRVLSSDFDFGCPDAPPNSNPIHCHPNVIVVVPFLCFRQAF